MASTRQHSVAEEFLGAPDPREETVPLYVVRGAMDGLLDTEDRVRHQRQMLAASVGFDRRRVTDVQVNDLVRVDPRSTFGMVISTRPEVDPDGFSRTSLAFEGGLCWSSANDMEIVDVQLPEPVVPF